MRCLLAIICLGLFLFTDICDAGTKEEKMGIQKGSKVSFDYKLTVDGQTVDSSEEKGPLEYIHGEGQIIPGLAKQLEGLGTGDERVIQVSPEEGYGLVDSRAFQEVPKTSLPEGLDPKVGMYLRAQGPDGQALPVKITEIKESSIIIDLNHPLAGKTLTFEVKIVSVE
ncbi:MAG: peptidylprolyl isomerase [Candidatus Omnitrophota bacterium]|nr:MAG: peptidylprolyl isomerase [Candidatus Omnitrophota bacterium]